jgi:hypothetical protein
VKVTTVSGEQRTVMARVDRVGAWGATVEQVAVPHRCPNRPAASDPGSSEPVGA